MKNFILWGRILRPHGLTGELLVQPLLASSLNFKKLKKIYLLSNPKNSLSESAKITGFRFHQDKYLIKLRNIDSLEKAEKLRNHYIAIPRLPLPSGHFYVRDLVGIEVYTNSDEYLGEIADIFATGANDIWVIRNRDRELFFPALKSLVKEIDFKNKKLKITLLPGLKELNE